MRFLTLLPVVLLAVACGGVSDEGGAADAAAQADGSSVVDGGPGPDGASAPDAAGDPDANLTDSDGDGVLDLDDNCVDVPNAAQQDQDEDNVGDHCDAEFVDAPHLFYVPAGVEVTVQGDHCAEQVVVAGTALVAPLVAEGEGTGVLTLRGPSITVTATGAILAVGAGGAGGLANETVNLGGHAGLGASPGCGSGFGGSVGRGGAGAGHGGAGGAPGTEEGVDNWANACDSCDVPTIGHCLGAPGVAVGTDDGADVSLGSGGGAAGHSSECTDGPSGGAGGGAIVLVGDAVVIDGIVSANGSKPAASTAEFVSDGCEPYRPGGGGGSGGSVIVSTESLTVGAAAVISAKGGDGGDALGSADPDYFEFWGWAGGGGGGGRVKIFAATTTGTVAATVLGGAGGQAPSHDGEIEDEDYNFIGSPGSDGVVSLQTTLPKSLSATCE